MPDPTSRRIAAVKRSALRVFGLVLFLLCIDGCLYRDPYIKLPHGYGIGSYSNSSPCGLEYNASDDHRNYSSWEAFNVSSVDDDGNAQGHYLLTDRDADKSLYFDNEEDWRAAIEAHSAKPNATSLPRIENIRHFNSRGAIVYGDCAGGYFILDIEHNDIRVIDDESEWQSRVEKETGAPPGFMWSASSFWLQHRDPWYRFVTGILAIVALALIYRRRHTPIGHYSEKYRSMFPD